MAKFWTKRGIEILGEVVKQARKKRGWSIRDIERLTEEVSKGYHRVSDDMMSYLERGVRIPAHNTVVAIAALKFVINPVTGEPFTEDELFDIAAEYLNPETGRYRLRFEEPTIAALIKLELKNRPWSQEQLAIEKLAEVAKLEPMRLEALISGERPTDEELANLAQVLTKDDGSVWKEVELQEIRLSSFPQTHSEEDVNTSTSDLAD